MRIQNNEVASVQNPQNGSWTVSGNGTSKARQHWEGDPGAPKVAAGRADGNFAAPAARAAAPVASVLEEADAGGAAGGQAVSGVKSGKAELFRIGERMLDDDRPLRLEDVDFAGGDVIVFSNFDRGEFRHDPGGNPVVVWKDGSGARLDSALDMREVFESSPGVKARTQGDELIVEIDDAEIIFAGLGGPYRAADPDLF